MMQEKSKLVCFVATFLELNFCWDLGVWFFPSQHNSDRNGKKEHHDVNHRDVKPWKDRGPRWIKSVCTGA